MDLLKKGSDLIRLGNVLLFAPKEGEPCVCCTRYECVQGSAECQHCVVDPAGPYKTLEECQEACPVQRCAWCIEEEREGPCGETYYAHSCFVTGCDEEGECIVPSAVVISGPVMFVDGEEPDCLTEVCYIPPPPPPPVPECCDRSDCPCCFTCIDGDCVYCPDGYICIDCECRPIDEVYYCCMDPPEYGEPYPEPYCQRGPCLPPATTVGGPYRSYLSCCESCGCRYECDGTYACRPTPTGTHDTYEACAEVCEPPPDNWGACCYTIEPWSEDNNWNQPPFKEKCAAIKGCFGMMSHADCMALDSPDTGTHTVWQEEYDSCSLCPVTWSWVCCFADPDDPCTLRCEETDPNCCEDIGGEDHPSLRTCEDEWPSGLDACRNEACMWPIEQEEWFFEAQLRHRTRDYLGPPPLPPPNGDHPCMKSPVYKVGGLEKYADCDTRWVRDMSECTTFGPQRKKVCVRYRLYLKIGSVLQDITGDVVFNAQELECCGCERDNNWVFQCVGDECEPLDYFPDIKADCLP